MPPPALVDFPAEAVTTFHVGSGLNKERFPVYSIKVVIYRCCLLLMRASYIKLTLYINIKHPCTDIDWLQWLPDGRRLVTGSASGEFTLWNGQCFNFESLMRVSALYNVE